MEKVFKKRWLLNLFTCAMMSCFALTSCGDDDKDEPNDPTNTETSIIGKWLCTYDAYGEPYDEPIEIVFDMDRTGYMWFQDEGPFSTRDEFEYVVTNSKIHIYWDGDVDDKETIRYELIKSGKELILYGLDDNDMAELHFKRK